MSLPASIKNQIKKDVTACIVEEGEDPEQCIVNVARYHRLTREQADEIPDLMDLELDDDDDDE